MPHARHENDGTIKAHRIGYMKGTALTRGPAMTEAETLAGYYRWVDARRARLAVQDRRTRRTLAEAISEGWRAVP